jgi:hypothetical protein
MKTRLILYFVLLNSPYIFSQDEIGISKLKSVNDYWSLGFYASGNMRVANGYDNKPIQPGFGGTIEFAYNDTKRELLFQLSKNRLYSGSENTHYETFELTLGPRFIDKSGGFIEFNIGALFIKKEFIYPYIDFEGEHYYELYANNLTPNLCGSAAAGAKIRINNHTDFIFKLRLTTSFQKKCLPILQQMLELLLTIRRETKKLNPQKQIHILELQ